MVSSYDIWLTLSSQRPYFHSSLEVLSGDVRLSVRKQIEIESVEISFEGISKTQTMAATRTESHYLVSRRQLLFPLPGTQGSESSKKKFKLTAGVYDYHFDLKIPQFSECGGAGPQNGVSHIRSLLPPSLSGVEFNIDYELKATVKTASRLKSNITTHRFLVFRPFDPIDEMLTNSLPLFARKEAIFKNVTPPIISNPPVTAKDVPFAFEVRIDAPFMTAGKPPNFKLFITSTHGPERYRNSDGTSNGIGKFRLQNLVLELKCMVNVRVEMESGVVGRTYPLVARKDIGLAIDLARLVRSPLADQVSNARPYEFEIPRQIYDSAEIDKHATPTFKTCNLEMNYTLNITTVFTGSKRGSKVMTGIAVPIKLLAGVPPPEEYIQAKGIPLDIAADFLRMYHASESQAVPGSAQPLPLYQPPPSYDAPPADKHSKKE